MKDNMIQEMSASSNMNPSRLLLLLSRVCITRHLKYFVLLLAIFFCLPISLLAAAQLPGPGGGVNTPIPGMPDFTISDQELKEMFDFLETLSPEELAEFEALGRQILTDMGINPDTLQPTEPTAAQPTPVVPPVVAPVEPAPPVEVKPAKPEIAPALLEEVRKIIPGLANVLAEISGYAYLHDMSAFEVMENEIKINSIIFYLFSIDRHDHHARFAEAKWSDLLKTLKAAYEKMSKIAASLKVEEKKEPQEDNPYTILAISSRATPEEIEEAYKKKADQLNPKHIREEAEKEGVSERDIERLIKQSKLSFNLIQDAFEKLSDPAMKEQIDEELKAQKAYRESVENLIDRVLKDAVLEMKNFFINQKGKARLEEFMRAYEPMELESRKKAEAAEQARRKERETLAQQKPIQTFGQYEPQVRFPKPKPAADTGSFIKPPSFIPPSSPEMKPSGLDTSLPRKEEPKKTGGKKPDGKPAEPKKDEKKEDKKEDKKDKPSETKRGPKGRGPQYVGFDEKTAKLIKELEASSNELTTWATKDEVKNNLAKINTYLHDVSSDELDPAIDELLGKLLEQSKMGDFVKKLEKIKSGLPEKVSPAIPGYTQLWDPVYKNLNEKVFPQILKGTDKIFEDAEERPLNRNKLVAHAGIRGEGKLSEWANLLKKLTDTATGIEKVIHSEKYKDKK